MKRVILSMVFLVLPLVFAETTFFQDSFHGNYVVSSNPEVQEVYNDSLDAELLLGEEAESPNFPFSGFVVEADDPNAPYLQNNWKNLLISFAIGISVYLFLKLVIFGRKK